MLMPSPMHHRSSLSALLALALVAACGGGDRSAREAEAAADEATEAEATPAADAAGTPAPVPAAARPLEVADIDRWEKGLAAELEAVQAAGEKLKGAKSGEDTLSAMMGVQESSTLEAGAKAAGVDLERYRFLRSNLSAAASYLAPHLGGIDTTMLSSAQRDEMRQMNESQLQQLEKDVPKDVIEALRPRAETLRKQDLELVGARLKGAGV
jgi:hypothetical protein